MENILKDSPDFHDFKILFRSNTYEINIKNVQFVSPKIVKLASSPEKENFIEFPPISGNIDDFINILYGKDVPINKRNALFIHFAAKYFEIEEIAKNAEIVCNKELKISNILGWAENLISAGLPAKKEVDVLASNVSVISDQLYVMSYNLVEQILTSDKLVSRPYEKRSTIQNLIRQNPEKFSKLSSLLFSDVKSMSDMSTLLDMDCIDLNNSRGDISNFIKAYKPLDIQKKMLIPLNPNHCGAIHYVNSRADPKTSLINKPLRTRAENSELLLTAKSCFNDKFSVTHIIPTGNPACSYCSKGEKDENITVLFKHAKLRVTNYAIKSHENGGRELCPYSWKLEGLDDRNRWVVIDEQTETRELAAPSEYCVFNVRSNYPPMKSFKLTQLDSIHSKNKKMYISEFELFGELYY